MLSDESQDLTSGQQRNKNQQEPKDISKNENDLLIFQLEEKNKKIDKLTQLNNSLTQENNSVTQLNNSLTRENKELREKNAQLSLRARERRRRKASSPR